MPSTVRWPRACPERSRRVQHRFLGGSLGSRRCVLTQVSLKTRREPGAPGQPPALTLILQGLSTSQMVVILRTSAIATKTAREYTWCQSTSL